MICRRQLRVKLLIRLNFNGVYSGGIIQLLLKKLLIGIYARFRVIAQEEMHMKKLLDTNLLYQVLLYTK